jgi:hypothetical protein
VSYSLGGHDRPPRCHRSSFRRRAALPSDARSGRPWRRPRAGVLPAAATTLEGLRRVHELAQSGRRMQALAHRPASLGRGLTRTGRTHGLGRTTLGYEAVGHPLPRPTRSPMSPSSGANVSYVRRPVSHVARRRGCSRHQQQDRCDSHHTNCHTSFAQFSGGSVTGVTAPGCPTCHFFRSQDLSAQGWAARDAPG